MVFVPDLLAGRVAVVTGGGTGIGRAIALELARAGANVAVAGRRSEPLDEACKEIEALGRRALAISTDVRDEERVKAMVECTVAQLGSVDILVNNAGGQFAAPFEEMSAKGWKAVLDVNLNGVFNCIHAVAPHMIQQRRGKIINILAGFTRRAAPRLAHSGAARAGVENLSRSLALEWAPHNIQINCISPVVMTEAMAANMSPEQGGREAFERGIPAGRGGLLEEVGWLAVYLSSHASDFMTGEHLVLDGGYWLSTAVGARPAEAAE